MVLPRKRRIWAYYLQNQSIRLFHSGAGKAGGCWKAIQGTPFPLPSGPKTLHSKHSHPLQQGISHLLKRNQNTVKKKKSFQLRFQVQKSNSGAAGVAVGIPQLTKEQVAQMCAGCHLSDCAVHIAQKEHRNRFISLFFSPSESFCCHRIRH